MTRRTAEDFDRLVEAVKEHCTTPPMMQMVVLTLADGRKVTFSGPAQIFEDGAVIIEAGVTKPAPLPPGCSWENWTNSYKEAP